MSGQIEFEKAKSKLNTSLEELEDLIISKIPDKSLRVEVEDLRQEVAMLKEELEYKDRMIETLDSEVNNLQKNMAEIGNETEFLNEKNKSITDNYKQKEEQQRVLLEDIVDYVNQIEELVKNEN